MALARTAGVNELHILKDDLAHVPQVKQVFAQSDAQSLSVLIILDEYDRVAERKIIQIEAALVDAYPWIDIDFDVVYLCGRLLTDVVSPKGFQLL
jgi:hypothetical protein